MSSNIANSEVQLLEALESYFQAVELQKQPTPEQRPALRPYVERLDTLTAQLLSEVDPQLHHFMVRKSYEKALGFLRQRK